MEELLSTFASKFNYIGFVILMMVGMYAMIAKHNLVKKIIGMSIFQSSIFLFYVSTSFKIGATIPIIKDHQLNASTKINAVEYVNPLPHVLMLTAIVVSVATLGVALALAIKIFRQYGTLEENEIYSKINNS